VTVNGNDEYIPTQHIQTMNEGRKKVAEQDEQKSFTVWGRVDIKQDTKNRKFTDVKAKTRDEAKEKALELLRSEARKNKQGSVKSAVVSKVQENK
jgi:predicted DNA-binding WGR domain protein